MANVKKETIDVVEKAEDKKIETKVEPKIEVEAKKETVVQPKKRIKVDRTTEVKIMNNTNGIFIYENDKTNTSCILTKFGDEDYLTIDELLKMKNSHRDIIEKFWIRIVNVENEEIEMEDVLNFLLIDDLYKNALNAEQVDEMLLTESDERFETVFLKLHKEFKNRIIERATILFEEKRFNDFYKMQLITEYLNNDEFFKEIAERK